MVGHGRPVVRASGRQRRVGLRAPSPAPVAAVFGSTAAAAGDRDEGTRPGASLGTVPSDHLAADGISCQLDAWRGAAGGRADISRQVRQVVRRGAGSLSAMDLAGGQFEVPPGGIAAGPLARCITHGPHRAINRREPRRSSGNDGKRRARRGKDRGDQAEHRHPPFRGPRRTDDRRTRTRVRRRQRRAASCRRRRGRMRRRGRPWTSSIAMVT